MYVAERGSKSRSELTAGYYMLWAETVKAAMVVLSSFYFVSRRLKRYAGAELLGSWCTESRLAA